MGESGSQGAVQFLKESVYNGVGNYWGLRVWGDLGSGNRDVAQSDQGSQSLIELARGKLLIVHHVTIGHNPAERPVVVGEVSRKHVPLTSPKGIRPVFDPLRQTGLDGTVKGVGRADVTGHRLKAVGGSRPYPTIIPPFASQSNPFLRKGAWNQHPDNQGS